ncbi:hypothetical protein HH213_19955 [Duganella dendranthematis]|uniref:Transmembrane protein n=1 Tax=Duganella dendranthematis TaxID=2728021 RepID=A0ABX6MD65_9BURK|nr:hypothetical protein [Duganella dendranthematis]QJD92165.1 hypothetical protein HH213_19955 [Duganella dendranthematis]
MEIAIKIGKCCLLLLIGMSIAILWVYCHGFLPHELYGGKAINPDAERLGGMITLAVLFAAPAWPVNRLFPTRTVLASAIVGWIPLALSLALAYQTNMAVNCALSINLATVEGVLCWFVIILGAWIVRTISKPRL